MRLPPRPAPGNPPLSYGLHGGRAVFYRHVSTAELVAWRTAGRLIGEPGGMELGKHVTTTPELAWAWGRKLLRLTRQEDLGHVLEIRISESLALEVDFVGPRTDGVGTCYFIRLEQLVDAAIAETHP